MVVISNQDIFDDVEGLDDIEEDEEEYSGREQKLIKKKWKKREEERSKISAPNSYLDKKKRLKKLQIDAEEGSSSQRNFGGTGKGKKRKLERSLFTIGDDEEGEAPEEEEDVPETLQINEENNDAPPANASSIRLSFRREMKSSGSLHKVHIPYSFVRSTGIRANMVLKLINISGREWPVRVMKNSHYSLGLSRGWCHFLYDNKVMYNSILSFVWLGENKLQVQIEKGSNKPMFNTAPRCANSMIQGEPSKSSRTKRSNMMVAPASSYESESFEYEEESANNTTSISFTGDESDSEEPAETTIRETSMLTAGMTVSDPIVLNCPICLCPLTIPVHQCDEGHISCQSCYDKIKDKRPTCSKPIGNNHCIGVENILKSIIITCINMQYGCMKKISFCKILDHENSCKYAARTSCPHFRCDYVGMVKSFYYHYVEKHPDSCKLITFNNVNFINVVGEEQYLLFEKKEKLLFYLSRVIDPLGSFVCVSTASNLKVSYDLTAVSSDKSINAKSVVEIASKCFTKPAREKCFFIVRTFHREASNGVSMLPLELVIRKGSL